MPIPTTTEMVLSVLRHIADGQEYRRKNIIDILTEHFSLTVVREKMQEEPLEVAVMAGLTVSLTKTDLVFLLKTLKTSEHVSNKRKK